MLHMCRDLGFAISEEPDAPYVCNVRLTL
jgi:hypothetical protein